MEPKYNSMAFTPEEVEKGLHLKLLNTLLELNKEQEKSYNDIHICSDGYCTIIEWVNVYYDESIGGGKFEFVDEDQIVALEKIFPDGHYELCYNEDDYKEKIKNENKEINDNDK